MPVDVVVLKVALVLLLMGRSIKPKGEERIPLDWALSAEGLPTDDPGRRVELELWSHFTKC